MDSPSLYLKIIYADYETGYAIIEFIGEWNDCIHNDIMLLKRDVVDQLIECGITRFILIGENVLNFHGSDESYYQEWYEDIEDGWICALNFRSHVLHEFRTFSLDNYFVYGGELNDLDWRTYDPYQLLEKIESVISRRITI